MQRKLTDNTLESVSREDTTSSLFRIAELPKDPALRAICDEVIERFKYAFAASAVGPQRSAPEDMLFTRFFASRSAKSRDQYRSKAEDLFRRPEAERRDALGRYAGVALDTFATVGTSGLPRSAPSAALDPPAVERALRALASGALVRPQDSTHAVNPAIGKIDPAAVALARHPITLTPPRPNPPRLKLELDPDVIRGAHYRKLGLFLTSVRCLLESDELGDDEIEMGGTLVRPDGGTSIINPFHVAKEMGSDSGDTHLVTYPGEGHKFAEWDLVIPGPHKLPEAWPTYYGTVVSMAENDGGGFYEFLKKLWDKVSAEVTTAIGGAVGSAVGGALGGVVGAIAGAIVGALIGWIITLFQNPDEILGVVPVDMYLGAMTESYYAWAKLIGVPHPFKLNFYGDNSHYTAEFHFRVYP